MRPMVGFALCGSFCTYERVLAALETLAASYELQPIFSERSARTDTRFGTAASFRRRVEALCGRLAWDDVTMTEPIGPRKLLDLLIVAPCTGNTLAKLAAGIADSSVTLAVKAQLRNERPVVLAVSTNDGLSTAAQNIGALLCRAHYFFVPFGQDDPAHKPRSLVAGMELLPETAAAALRGEQLQPMLLAPPE